MTLNINLEPFKSPYCETIIFYERNNDNLSMKYELTMVTMINMLLI